TITRCLSSASRISSLARETGSSGGYSRRQRIAFLAAAADSAAARRASSFAARRDVGRPSRSLLAIVRTSASRSSRLLRGSAAILAASSALDVLAASSIGAVVSTASERVAGAAELDDDLGAAERRALDGERSAVKLHGLAHDRKPDPLPRRRLVRAHAALGEPLDLFRPDPRAVVADLEHEPIGPRLDADRDACPAVLVCVVEQVAEQLGQVARVAMEDRARHDPRLELDALVPIDLVERVLQVLHDGRDGDRLDAQARRAARTGAAQLIRDPLIHALHLACERRRHALLPPFRLAELGEEAPHRRERRFQRMREILEHVPIAYEPP